jgi:hypothetical protein
VHRQKSVSPHLFPLCFNPLVALVSGFKTEINLLFRPNQEETHEKKKKKTAPVALGRFVINTC